MFGLIICKKPRGKLPGNLLHGKWSSPSCSRGRLEAQTEQEVGLKDGGDRSTVFLQTSMAESSYAAEAFSQPCGCFVFFLPTLKKKRCPARFGSFKQAARRFIEVLKCSRIVGFTALWVYAQLKITVTVDLKLKRFLMQTLCKTNKPVWETRSRYIFYSCHRLCFVYVSSLQHFIYRI